VWFKQTAWRGAGLQKTALERGFTSLVYLDQERATLRHHAQADWKPE